MTDRRRVLALLASAGIGSIAGCGSQDGDDTTTETKSSGSDGTPAQTTLTPTQTPASITSQTDSQKIAPAGAGKEHNFGVSLVLSGDGTTAIIGANGDDNQNGQNAGAAYVFTRASGTWQQQVKLTPDDGGRGDGFGSSVGIAADGSTAIIGASGDDNPNGQDAGAAYVFTRSNGTWQRQAKLTADDGNLGDQFGSPIGLTPDGNTAIIGATGGGDPNGEGAGSAYVFTQTGGTWQQQAKLTADDGDRQDFFGRSVGVAADGNTAVVGASDDQDPNGEDAGSAYVFTRVSGMWQQQTKIAPDDGDTRDNFGISAGMTADGGTAIIGSWRDDDPYGENAGSAYIFTRTGREWQQQAKLIANDGDEFDEFGKPISVAADGKTAIIGASRDENPNGREAGSAYVFSADSEE